MVENRVMPICRRVDGVSVKSVAGRSLGIGDSGCHKKCSYIGHHPAECTIYKKSFAVLRSSPVATATRASNRPMPESRGDEFENTLVRGSRSA